MKGKSMPGPGQYGRADAPRPSTGVLFSESNAKSDIEWKMYRASKIPGPGQYKVPAPMDGNDGRGVKFSDANTKSELHSVAFSFTHFFGTYVTFPRKVRTEKLARASGG